ncbi:MAG: heparinase II/III family protein [candidate division Zixibacteria bacterium]|nr:heparinase II/III family protein [candidate division Zixibacteria bacterium]
MSKFAKVLRKVAAGNFRELTFRAREQLNRRRERRHHAAGRSWFCPENYREIFTEAFSRTYGGVESLDLRQALRDKDPARFFPGFSRSTEFPEFVRRHAPDDQARIQDYAHSILQGSFPVFHRPPISYGSPTSWNFDPDARRSAPEAFYAEVPYLDSDLAGDSKIIWELSRLQFVYDLAQAYLLTGEEQFSAHFWTLLSDWNRHNRDYHGINFCSALEFAFRAQSVAWAVFAFRGSESVTPAVAADAYRLLHISGRFLRDHLSVYFAPNTHLLGEAYGLYLLGTVFPEFCEAAEWRSCGRRLLLQELDRQFTHDDLHAEMTTCYHAYALEFTLSFLLLAERNGDPLPPAVRRRLTGMVETLRLLQRPDGRWPAIGDDDGGRLYFLSRPAAQDYSPILTAATRYLGIHQADEAVSLEAFWLAPKAETVGSGEQIASALLKDSGLLVSRAQDCYSVFQFGRFGYLDSPHSHADHLHLEIAVGEDALLIDPGTYSYTGNRAGRNQFRSCLAHNGPRIFGAEYYDPEDVFAWTAQPACRLSAYLRCDASEYFRAAYSVNLDGGNLVELERAVIFLSEGGWLVADSVIAQKPVQAAWDFRAAQPIQWKEKTGIIAGRRSSLTILPFGLYSCDVEMTNSWVPIDYGRGHWGGSLRVIAHFARETHLGWVLLPGAAAPGRRSGAEPAQLYERTQTNAPENEAEQFYLFRFEESPDQRLDTDAEFGYASFGPLEAAHIVLVNASRLKFNGGELFRAAHPLQYVDLTFDGAVWVLRVSRADGIIAPDPSMSRIVTVGNEA